MLSYKSINLLFVDFKVPSSFRSSTNLFISISLKSFSLFISIFTFPSFFGSSLTSLFSSISGYFLFSSSGQNIIYIFEFSLMISHKRKYLLKLNLLKKAYFLLEMHRLILCHRLPFLYFKC